MKFFDTYGVSRMQHVVFFLLKLTVAACVWLLYTYYYNAADFRNYFQDSTKLVYNLFHQQQQPLSQVWNGSFETVLFSSSKVMILFHALLHLFSWGNYYVHVVILCFMSFTGLVAVYKTFVVHFPESKNRILMAVFFVPSILFWTSAPGKEAFVIAIVGWLLCLTDLGLRRKYTATQLVFVLLLIVLLGLIKIYVLLALSLPLLVNVWVSITSSKFLVLKYMVALSVFVLIAVGVSSLHPDYNVLKIISNKQAKAISEAKGGAFLANKEHFICLDYKSQYEHLIWQHDSTYRIQQGSSYLMWTIDNMQDTTFVTNSTDTSLFEAVYAVEPAGSVLEIKKLEPTLKAYLLFAPFAIVNVFVHPTFFEVHSWLHLLVAIENMWVLILVILSSCFFNADVLKKKEIIVFCWFVALFLFALIGITTPVLGAMVRYKIFGLLFVLIASFVSLDTKKMKRFFDRWSKK